MVELAVTIDAAMPFVKATYNLEGDGLLSLTCYLAISALNAAAKQVNYTNLQALARDLFAGDRKKEEELSQYAKSCVQPGITYYFQQLSTNIEQVHGAFKTAHLLISPHPNCMK